MSEPTTNEIENPPTPAPTPEIDLASAMLQNENPPAATPEVSQPITPGPDLTQYWRNNL